MRAAPVVLGAERAHPAVEAGELPPGWGEHLGEEHLAEAVRVHRGGVGVRHERVVEGGAGGDPAEAHAGRHDLGEGVDADDAAVSVEREERAREGRLGGGRRVLGRVVLEEVVRVVFDDDEVEALCEGVDRLAAREAERRARRVLPAGDEVDDVRAAAARGVPGGEDALELRRDHAAVVHLDADPLDALREGHVRHGAERELVREEGVAGFAEQPEALGDPVRVAECERAEVVRGRVVELRNLGHDALGIGEARPCGILHPGLDGERARVVY